METKIGSSFSEWRRFKQPNTEKALKNSRSTSARTDTFVSNGTSYYESHREQIDSFTKAVRGAVKMDTINISMDDHEGMTKSNFDWIKKCEDGLNKNIPEKLEAAGVPKDVTFEFDFDFDAKNIEITGVSDEKYRENIECILNDRKASFDFIACASRVMNGNIPSLYYPWISKSLDRCFGQDINDLYIDENGDLGGINENFQAALNAIKKAEKDGKGLNVTYEYGFPAYKNVEQIVKRMVSEKNATPNISHMGYDGERIYTNDGEFKFGRDFDPNLFKEEKYLMRGTMAFYMSFYGNYNSWLENEEKFY